MNTTLIYNPLDVLTFPKIFETMMLKSKHPLSPLPATLFCFEPYGYMISSLGQIIEYDINTKLFIDPSDHLTYFGPLHLFSNSSPIKRINNPHPVTEEDWIGISSQDFKLYTDWINRDGTCGMLSATVLLAYYQDQIESHIVHRRLREPFSKEYQTLYEVMLTYVKTLMIQGTIAPDITIGLNRYFRDYGVNTKLNYEFKARFKLLTTFGIMRALLDSKVPKPGIVGLFKWLGSPKNYLNHWVVAYSYRIENHQKYYQVHDNHGRYNAVVNVNWTSSVIRLSRHLKEGS